MKVYAFLLVALLSACCPVPLQGQATAFRAEVAGVSPDVSALHLKGPQNARLLTLVLTKGVLRSSTGGNLPLSSLHPGDDVYVQGTLRDGDLVATRVRRLE